MGSRTFQPMRSRNTEPEPLNPKVSHSAGTGRPLLRQPCVIRTVIALNGRRKLVVPYDTFTVFWATPESDPAIGDHVPEAAVHVLPSKETLLMW